MATGPTRDDDELRAGLEAWLGGRRIVELTRPASGYSSETVIVTVAGDDVTTEKLVLRFPLLVASYPDYDLHVQARVLDALAANGVPAPHVVACEDDSRWLGSPFLAMSFVAGRPGGEVPALDPWLLERPAPVQRAAHEAFFAALARVHRIDARPLTDTLRVGLDAEIEYWTRYVYWAAGPGAPARALVAALDWCARTVPVPAAAPSLLWGDARLGNVMFDDEARVVALLDWELATIGPAEMDLAWYLALDALTTTFVRRTVPAFLDRDASIATYERALGRRVHDLAWHEIFALVRSIAINDRQARLADLAGTPYPGVAGDANPVLDYLDGRIAECAG